MMMFCRVLCAEPNPGSQEVTTINSIIMFRPFIFTFCLVLLFLASCADSPQEAQDSVSENTATTQPASSVVDQLKANAIDESDYLGRVRATLTKLQKEYDGAQGKMPGIGKVTTSIDEDFTLSVQNEVDGNTLLYKVNLKSIDPGNNGMRLLPDTKAGEYPGLRLLVQDGKPGVSVFKNGELQNEERYFDIYLPQRHNIENIAPVMSSILNVVHGRGEGR